MRLGKKISLARHESPYLATIPCKALPDKALHAEALARSRGMTQVAKDSGITREALYKALRSGSEPRFDTISRVCAALGVRLVAQPIYRHATA